MNALTFQGIRQISYERVPDPRIEDARDLIVRVNRTAICGSDMHIYHGREQGQDPGTVMGHEFVGEIVEVGADVHQLHKGMQVVSPFTTNCGRCYYCRIGLTCRCEQGQLYGWVSEGHGLQGAQAEYVRVPLAEATLLPYPEDISPDLALLSGDILATGFYCAERAELTPEGTYVLIGCGPVGLMALLAARQLGAQAIYAVDAVPSRLAQAQAWGAIPLNYQQEDVVEYVQQATQGRGADAVMEAVGSASAGRLAYEILRPGGSISSVGVHTSPGLAFSPTEAYDKNLTFRIGRCPARAYMPRLLPLIREKADDLQALLTHQAPLQQGATAYTLFDEKREGVLKVMLEP